VQKRINKRPLERRLGKMTGLLGTECTSIVDLAPTRLGATVSMKLKAGFVLAAIVSLAAGPAIFGQNGRPTSNHQTPGSLVPLQQNGKWGYEDGDGKIVIKPQFSRAGRFSEGLALVWTCGAAVTDPVVTSFVKMGYIDPTGHWVIHSRLEYYFYDDFSEGLVPFRKQFGRWGYMDKTGKIIIRARFDWAGNFSGGIAPVLLENKCAHIDKSGRVTDQSQTILPLHKGEQNGHGRHQYKPHSSPCS
jgi:hypothetical protein